MFVDSVVLKQSGVCPLFGVFEVCLMAWVHHMTDGVYLSDLCSILTNAESLLVECSMYAQC